MRITPFVDRSTPECPIASLKVSFNGKDDKAIIMTVGGIMLGSKKDLAIREREFNYHMGYVAEFLEQAIIGMIHRLFEESHMASATYQEIRESMGDAYNLMDMVETRRAKEGWGFLSG